MNITDMTAADLDALEAQIRARREELKPKHWVAIAVDQRLARNTVQLLMSGFSWGNSPQGHNFWASVQNILAAIADGRDSTAVPFHPPEYWTPPLDPDVLEVVEAWRESRYALTPDLEDAMARLAAKVPR